MTLRFNWGLGIALVYITFAAGTLTMVAIASTHRVELVGNDYYAQSLRVDDQMAAAERGQRAAVGTAIEHVASEDALLITWPADTAPDARGTITLYRPSSASEDRTVEATPDPLHPQRVPLSGLSTGHWFVQLRWTSGGHDYYVERRLVRPRATAR